MTRPSLSIVLLVVVGAAAGGCLGVNPDEGGFFAEGEGECCGSLTDDKLVTLHVTSAPERFDVGVTHGGFAFSGSVDVSVEAATGVFLVAVNSDPGFVDDVNNYAVVDVGSVASAGLRVDGNGIASGFSFGVAASNDSERDVDLKLTVRLDTDTSDEEVAIGRLEPRP